VTVWAKEACFASNCIFIPAILLQPYRGTIRNSNHFQFISMLQACEPLLVTEEPAAKTCKNLQLSQEVTCQTINRNGK
jgi:hypothetical protein